MELICYLNLREIRSYSLLFVFIVSHNSVKFERPSKEFGSNSVIGLWESTLWTKHFIHYLELYFILNVQIFGT